MRKLLLPILTFICLSAFSVNAQSSRIREIAEQLQQNIGSLADRSTAEFFKRPSNNREQTNNFLALQQLRLNCEILLLLVKNNRPLGELQETSVYLSESLSRFTPDNSTRTVSQQIKNAIEDFNNELRSTDSSADRKTDTKVSSVGNLFWHGTVDDEVHLIIRGNTVQAKTISGTEYTDSIFNFSSPLPEENVQISIKKKEGRGTAKVIQQPTSDNNFTAIIQILDKNGGAREYEMEITWTK